MKEKINILLKGNLYNIVVILSILGACLVFMIKEEIIHPILFLFFIAPFFLAIIWFFSKDRQIIEFKQFFSDRFPFFSKTLSVIFRIFVFLIFLVSIYIVIMGILSSLFQ